MSHRILPAKKDVLVPCPGCGEVKSADAGHHLCRQCEGYPMSDFGSTAGGDNG